MNKIHNSDKSIVLGSEGEAPDFREDFLKNTKIYRFEAVWVGDPLNSQGGLPQRTLKTKV